MTRPTRAVGRLPFILLFPALFACEEPTLPTHLDEIRYTSLSIDESTLEPAPGTTLTRGETIDYDVDIGYQRVASDMAADDSADIAFYVELWDSTATGWTWVSDAASDFDVVTDAQGQVSFSGTATIPAMGARCEPYDQVRFLAIMDPATNVSHRDVVNFQVTGDATPPTAGTAVFGETYSNSLVSGVTCEAWTLTLASATTVAIALDSEAFDSYLILQNASGTEIARDDDGGGYPNSLIVRDLAAGTYRILVTSYYGDTGAYTLSVTAPGGECVTAGSIAPGATVSGTLQAGDCELGAGWYYDVWLTTLSDTSVVTVDLTSSAFDAYLYVIDENGTIVGENDDADGTTTDARIQAELPPGEYTIAATSFLPATGVYDLSLEAESTAEPVVSIAAARAATPGTAVTVEGVITAGTGTYSAQTFYLQDATGGIAVFLGTGSSTGPFAAGDSVRLSGVVGASSQEVQIGGAVIVTPLGTTAVPAPVTVTAAQLTAGADQGELVEIQDAIVDSVGTPSTGGNFSVYLQDGSGAFIVFVDADSGIGTEAFQAGSTYDVTGIASRFNATFQVKPRSDADIALVAAGVMDIADARLEPAGAEVTVEGVITAGTGTYSAQTFYLQDATGGIAVFLGTGSSTGPFAEGDIVRLSGVVGAFNQEVQIGGAVTVTPLGTTVVPAPATVTAAQLAAGADQGELVEIQDALVDSVGTPSSGGNFSVYLQDATGAFVVFVDFDTGLTTAAFDAGSTYDVSGIASRFNATFQVKPRDTADIVLVSAGPMDIADARLESAGTEVTVEGVITAGTGTYSAQTFYLQDATGGIAVFLGTGSSTGPFAEGDSVRLSGVVGAFNQEVQIEGAVTVTPLGTTTVPAAVTRTAAQLLAGEDQGELVEIQDAMVDSVGTPSGSGNFSVYLQDATGAFTVFVDVDTGIGTGTFAAGSTYDVSGIASRFNATFQVKPRGTADIVLVSGGGTDGCTTWAPVALGDTLSGTLQATDCAPGDGKYYEGYRLDMPYQAPVLIRLESAEFDSYVIVTTTTDPDPSNPANRVLENNDFAGLGTDAQVSATFSAGTSWVIWVSTNAPGQTGAYQLSVIDIDGDGPTVMPIADVRPLSPGTWVAVEGVITAGTGVYDPLTFYLQDATAGIAVYLGGTAGTFTEGDSVRVSGLIGAFNGEVEISDSVAVTLLGSTTPPAPVTATVADLEADQWQGELVLVEDLLVDSIGTPSTSGSYSVWVSDPTNADFTVFVDGTTGIPAGTFSVGAVYDVVGIASRFGAIYQVKPRAVSDITLVGGGGSPCTTWQPIGVPETVSETLATTDCDPSDGYYYEGYELTVAADQSITVDLISAEFDAYLIITDDVNSDPSNTNNWLASDNNSAGGTDARIAATFPAGTYILWVSTNNTGQTGAYQLMTQ